MNKKTVLIGITIIIVVLAAPYLFFIFTTTMSKPTSFELSLPKDAKIQKVADNNKSISVLIVGNDKLYCYANNDLKSAKEYSLNEEPSFRKYLLEQK